MSAKQQSIKPKKKTIHEIIEKKKITFKIEENGRRLKERFKEVISSACTYTYGIATI